MAGKPALPAVLEPVWTERPREAGSWAGRAELHPPTARCSGGAQWACPCWVLSPAGFLSVKPPPQAGPVPPKSPEAAEQEDGGPEGKAGGYRGWGWG